MTKITEFKEFDKKDSRDKSALKKVRKFNFYDDHTIVSLYDDLGISCYSAKVTPVVSDNQFYVLLQFLNMKTLRKSSALVGAFDVLLTDDELGSTYRPEENLTKTWRRIMLRIYGDEYKKMLIRVLKDRKNNIDVALDYEINSLQ